MLSKERRINKDLIKEVLDKGKRYNSPSFVMYVYESPKEKSLANSKFAFSASKKVASLAVLRNRLRRVGYSAIEGNLNKIKEGSLMLFSYKKINGKPNFKKIEEELLGLLSEASMLK
jgi:ribonuclease P protein component